MKIYVLVTMYQLTHREDTIEFYKSRELACKARDIKLENFKEKLCIVTNIYEFELKELKEIIKEIGLIVNTQGESND